MIEKDYLMRQIRQLVQVLQQVLLQRQQGQVEEAHRTIRQAIGAVDEEDRGHLRDLPLREVIRFCRRDGVFRPEFATSVADLLNEEGALLAEQGKRQAAEDSYARALLLYRRAMQEDDATFPWNVNEKLSALETKISTERLDEIEAVLDREGGGT